MAEVAEAQVKVKRVAIVGGTHGNERNGVYLAKSFLRAPETVRRASFSTTVLLANTYASGVCLPCEAPSVTVLTYVVAHALAC
jgi:succinylglutamate desuccinylase